MSEKPQLTITISGEVGSGKSGLAIMIQDFLTKSKLLTSYTDEDTPEDLIRNTLDGRIGEVRDRGTLVKIQTRTTRPSEFPSHNEIRSKYGR